MHSIVSFVMGMHRSFTRKGLTESSCHCWVKSVNASVNATLWIPLTTLLFDIFWPMVEPLIVYDTFEMYLANKGMIGSATRSSEFNHFKDTTSHRVKLIVSGTRTVNED